MMITACSNDSKTVELSYPLEKRESTVVSTGLTVRESDYLNPSKEYSGSLASLCAVMSASAQSGALPQENLTQLGFRHIAKFSYEKSYEEDKVGVTMASKRIGDKTLLFLIIRGTKGREWYSNFDVGFGSEHEGFSLCADFLQQKISLYLTNYVIDEDDVRYLITGYSRGAAAANILAKRLIDEVGEERVQAYTFASPNTTVLENKEKYASVFNIVKADDVFTAIPFSKWGFHRYGTDVPVKEDNASPDEVREVFQSITGEDYQGFENSADTEKFVENAYRLAPTIDDYYHKRYAAGEYSLSVFDYMNIAAKYLCEEQTEEDGKILFETMDSEFAEVSSFFLSGVDMEELLLTGSIKKSSVADSHSMVSYMILMD